MQVKVPVKQIFPNPFQPEARLNVPESTAKEFGESILRQGLLLAPVGRLHPTKSNGTDNYQIADGWLRLSGHKWLVENNHPEFSEITLEVRELTDQQMADIVIEANEVRKNLSIIDKAFFYKECRSKFNITETELGKRYKISQGYIGNIIRLLELPKEVQTILISQEILGPDAKFTMSHARHLLSLKDWSGLQIELAKKVIATGMSVSTLEAEIRTITGKQKKSKVVEPPQIQPPQPSSPGGAAGTIQSADTKPETNNETIEAAHVEENQDSASSQDKTADLPSTENTNTPEKITDAPSPKIEPPAPKLPEKLDKMPIASKWKRKLAIEELASGVRISLMSEKGLIVKNLEGNLDTTLEQLPAIFAEANKKWEEK